MKYYTYNNRKLQYEPVNTVGVFLKTALVFFTLFLFLGLTNKPEVEYITETEKVLIIE